MKKNILNLTEDKRKSLISVYLKGNPKETVVLISSLLKDFPYEPLLFNLNGACQMEMGLLDEAIKSFKHALDINPDDIEIYCNLAKTLRANGQSNVAVSYYQKALKLNPNYSDAHYNLGNAFLSLNKLNSAVKSYEMTLKIKPNHADAHNNIGNALSQLRQFELAINHYKKAINLSILNRS